MQAKLFGGLRDVAVEVIEDALDVFPFDTREGRYWDVGVPCGTRVAIRLECSDDLIDIGGFAHIVIGAQPD